MRSLVALCVVMAATIVLAGCGGPRSASAPTTALLSGVHVDGTSATFEFHSPPGLVRTHFRPRSQIAESGSGQKVPLRGRALCARSVGGVWLCPA